MNEKRNAYKFIAGISELKRQIKIIRSREERNIKIIFKEIGYRCEFG
jgi:hypothetical protein